MLAETGPRGAQPYELNFWVFLITCCLSSDIDSCVRKSYWACLPLDRPTRNGLGRGDSSLKDGLLIKNKDI